MGLSIEEIKKRKLCKICDVHICNNNYELCPYQYRHDVQLCLTCKDRNFKIINGHPKCFYTCEHRKNEKKGLAKWL